MTKGEKDGSTMVPLFYKNLEYYPTLMGYSQLVTFTERAIWISIYVVFYAILTAFTYKKDKKMLMGLFGGFVSGLIVFLVEYSQKKHGKWTVFNELDNMAYSVSVDKKEPVANNWSIYVDESWIPKSNGMGYFVDTKSFDYNVKNNEFTAIPLDSIYSGVFKKTINMGSQSDPIFFSSINDYIAKNSFYIITTVLAWAVFIIKTKWFNFLVLFWILLALVLSIVTGTLIGQSWDIYNSNYIIHIKKVLLIFSMSIAVTSVLIA
ncbi:MAG: hypothetical protein ACXABD_04905 [Candidatus Thorarchaeota archaeon]|jgi:hypothetical protein